MNFSAAEMQILQNLVVPPPLTTFPEHFGCGYMRHVFDSPNNIIARANKFVGPYVEYFDTFVGTGMSGSAILMFLAHHFKRTFAIVRKEGVQSHSGYSIEGRVGERWLFVDDLIASGNTWRHVVQTMHNQYPHSKCYGAYLYQGECDDPDFKLYDEIVKEYGTYP